MVQHDRCAQAIPLDVYKRQVYNVQTLERTGISAVIIEDKQGLKKNSLFGTGAGQKQASIPDFCEKITAGKNAQKTKDFMIIARCESLILEQGLDDALTRCHAYVKAGADGIMTVSYTHLDVYKRQQRGWRR